MAAPVYATAADARRIYVSTSGNDSTGDGSMAAPLKTIAAGYALLRNGYPDWLLLKCGDEWGIAGGTGNGYFPQWTKSGRSASQRMIVTSYGTGALPKLNSGVHDGIQIDLNYTPQHVTFSDIHLFPHLYTGAEGAIKGISWLGGSNDISFDYMRIEGYAVGTNVQGYPSTGQPGARRHSNIRFYRCSILDSYATDGGVNAEGLLVGETDGLQVIECILDRNGWNPLIVGADPTIFRHNMYVNNGNTNVVVIGVIASRTDGIQVRCGGDIRECLVPQCVAGLVVGYGDLTYLEPNGVVVHMTRNVIVDGVPLDVGHPGIYGIRASNLVGGYARDNLVARATSMTDARSFWYTTIPGSSNRIANNFQQVRNRFYEAGRVLMEGADTQYSNVSIDACVLQSDSAPAAVVVESTNNNTFGRFRCSTAANKWHGSVAGATVFRTSGSDLTLIQWNQLVLGNDTNGTELFVDVTRSPATYMGTLGFTATYDKFYERLRLQSRQAWDDRLLASSVNGYIRGGFNM